MVFSAAAPSAIGNFDFIHVSEEKSLTVSISKNSPPMAAIADDSLPNIVMEPLKEMQGGRRTRILVSGVHAWPRLKKVSDAFEKQRIRQLQIMRLTVSPVPQIPPPVPKRNK